MLSTMSPYEAAPGALSLKGVIVKRKKKKCGVKDKFLRCGIVKRKQRNEEQAMKVPKTKHELAYEAAIAKRREQLLFKRAPKSHKQQIMEFNAKLDSLTEHFDIPKVSWTK